MSLILQLDSAGQPNKWITWKTAVIYHAKKLVAWELGEIETVVRGGTSAKTGKQSVIVTSSIICVKGKAKKKKYKVPTLSNRELFQRDHHMCAYCGSVYGDSKLTRDHIIPSSKGGPDTWKNCVTACVPCNQRKNDKRPEEAGMQLLYVPYEPSRAEYLILQNRNVLQDQMKLLLDFIPDSSPIKAHLASKQ